MPNIIFGEFTFPRTPVHKGNREGAGLLRSSSYQRLELYGRRTTSRARSPAPTSIINATTGADARKGAPLVSAKAVLPQAAELPTSAGVLALGMVVTWITSLHGVLLAIGAH